MESDCSCLKTFRAVFVAAGIGAAMTVTVFEAGCGQKSVSFSASVFPVLQQQCGQCHQPGGEGEQKSGFSVASYDSLMRGTTLGPVVVAGSAESSSLMRMVEHKTDPAIQMPHGNTKLSDEDIAAIRSWIDAGAKQN